MTKDLTPPRLNPSPHRARIGNGSLARRILLAMALLALVPLLIMTMQGLHCAHEAILEIEEAHLQSVLNARRQQFDAWLDERRQDLAMIGSLTCGAPGCVGPLGHADEAHAEWLRHTLAVMGQRYESLALYDADWTRVATRDRSTHADQDFLEPALRERLSATNALAVIPSHRHANGQAGLHLGLRLPSPDGGTMGYILANVDLGETLERILAGPTGASRVIRVYLLSAEGHYLSSPTTDRDMVGQPSGLAPAMLAAGTMRAHRHYGGGHGRKLMCSAQLTPLDWHLVAEIDEADALGWVAVLGRRALLTGSAAFLVVLVLAHRLARRLAEPLRVLADTARRITGGSHRERVGSLRGTEAQDVGRAFNEMLDALANAQGRLVQAASLAAIGELSASLVHEMRNPLSSVKLNLQALRKRVQGDRNFEELADIANEQTARLERMLAELLQYAKPRALKTSPLCFSELAAAAAQAMRGAAEARHVALQTVDEVGGRSFLVDFEQMMRAVTNLLQNAIEASPDGACVTLRGAPLDGGAEGVAVSVRDYGSGVPAALTGRLFQPFVTTREQGTGLGLANVRKIAELHGGRAAFRNMEDGGALFWIEIPDREVKA